MAPGIHHGLFCRIPWCTSGCPVLLYAAGEALAVTGTQTSTSLGLNAQINRWARRLPRTRQVSDAVDGCFGSCEPRRLPCSLLVPLLPSRAQCSRRSSWCRTGKLKEKILLVPHGKVKGGPNCTALSFNGPRGKPGSDL